MLVKHPEQDWVGCGGQLLTAGPPPSLAALLGPSCSGPGLLPLFLVSQNSLSPVALEFQVREQAQGGDRLPWSCAAGLHGQIPGSALHP